jgi:hypothetical protein
MNLKRLLDLTEQITVLRGSAGSGNYGHDGRPGKKGGSTRGGGLRRIGAKKDTPPGDRKKAAREFRDKRKVKKNGFKDRNEALAWIDSQNNLKYDLHGISNIADINNTLQTIESVTNKNQDIFFDLTGIHAKNIEPTLKQVDKLTQEWPEVSDRIKYIGTNPPGINWDLDFAYAKSLPSGIIGLNPSHFGDIDFGNQLSANKKTQWLAGHNVESIITHEFGHQVNYMLSGLGEVSLTRVSSNDFSGSIPDTVSLFFEKNKPTKKLSTYSLTNDSEAFAEAFSALKHGTKEQKETDFVKRFSSLMKFVSDKSKQVSVFDKVTPMNRYKYTEDEIEQFERDADQLRKVLNF